MMDHSTHTSSCLSQIPQSGEAEDLLFPIALEFDRNDFADFRRGASQRHNRYSQLVDVHFAYGAKIVYLRLAAKDASSATTIPSRASVIRVADRKDCGVVLGVIHHGTQYTVWLPASAGQFHFDDRGRIKASGASRVSYQWSFYPQVALTILQNGEPGEIAVFPYVVLEDPKGAYFEELISLSDVETRLYRKSDWFFASAPVDLWRYLINGSLYDPRSWQGIDRRFRCQQCAFAWWSYFDFLEAETEKKIYGLLRNEVAYSVLLDLSREGEWGHGYWSDEIETHARFHLDGIHLLLSQYENTRDSTWLEAAERAMVFVFDHLTDTLDDGTPWFLHDTLEEKKEYRVTSNIFGKKVGNSLCINTHVQALTVLHRLSRLSGHPLYADNFAKGASALRRVLDYQPGEPFYRFLAFLLARFFQRLSHTDAVWRRIDRAAHWRVTRMLYWQLKRFFPRLVLPGGFIERDLTLSVGADDYHITNLKDLLTLYQQKPYAWQRPYIENAFSFERELIRTWGMSEAVARSPYYFEFVDILDLYGRLIKPISSDEIALTEQTLSKTTGGCSLDYYVSRLVRPRERSPIELRSAERPSQATEAATREILMTRTE